MTFDLVPVVGADERAGLRRVVDADPQPDPVGAPADLGDEAVVDRVLDDRPAAGRADLAGVDEGRGQRVVDGRLEVGVGEDDVRALAAELEGDPLDVDRRAAEQRPAGVEPAGQRDEVDVGAVGQRLPDARPGPRTRLTTPPGSPGLLEQPGQVDRAQRRVVGRLHHRRVAGGQRRGDLPAHLEERVVPRPDQRAHADRFVDDPAQRVRVVRVDQAPGLLVGQVGVVAEDPGDVAHVPAALAHRLAGVQRLEPGHLLEVAVDERRDPVEQRRSVPGRRARPVGRVEGAPSRGDRRLDLVVRRDVDLADDAGVGRVDDRARGPVGRRRPTDRR